jgi:hypothetical protein
VREEGGESPSQCVGVAEAVGWEKKVAGCDTLAKRQSSDESGNSGDDVGLGEGRDRWLDCTVCRLPDGDKVTRFLNGVVTRKSCGRSGFIVFENVVPDANLQSALSGVRHASPVHVQARFGHD